MVTPDLNEPPTRLCCGTAHYGPVCPDGKVMCVLCFERFSIDQLKIAEDGWRVDVCADCAREDEDPSWPAVYERNNLRQAFEDALIERDSLRALCDKLAEALGNVGQLLSVTDWDNPDTLPFDAPLYLHWWKREAQPALSLYQERKGTT